MTVNMSLNQAATTVHAHQTPVGTSNESGTRDPSNEAQLAEVMAEIMVEVIREDMGSMCKVNHPTYYNHNCVNIQVSKTVPKPLPDIFLFFLLNPVGPSIWDEIVDNRSARTI